MNNKTINTFAILALIVLLTVEIKIFGNLFPWTGLKAIIVTPMIYGICISISILGILITKNNTYRIRITAWITIFLINTIIAAIMYPQEFRPPVIKQIKYTFDVVNGFE